MSNFDNEAASFYKIFFTGFSSKLRIPNEFVKKYEEILPKISLLKTDESGKSWDVKIKPVDDHFYITDGWPDFVKDNHLAEMDFLVFRLANNKSCFKVTIYGMEGCLKECFSSSSHNSDRYPCRADEGQTSKKCQHAARLPEIKQENQETSGELKGLKSYTSVIKNHQKYSMDIPKAFAIETGIARKKAIKLQNRQGKKWRVAMGVEVQRQNPRFRLRKGWWDFREANKVLVGTKCRFEFDSITGNLVVLKIERERADVRSKNRGSNVGSNRGSRLRV